MRELTVRALHHAAALGDPGAAAGARLLAADVDNPALQALVCDYPSRAAASSARDGTASLR